MSYEIDPLISGRVNASNYDIADMIAVINKEKVENQVDTESKIKDSD